MTNNPIIFSSFIHSDLKEKMDRFHSIYKAMDQSTNGNIISFLMDDNGEIIGYNLHGNKLNSLFFGPPTLASGISRTRMSFQWNTCLTVG